MLCFQFQFKTSQHFYFLKFSQVKLISSIKHTFKFDSFEIVFTTYYVKIRKTDPIWESYYSVLSSISPTLFSILTTDLQSTQTFNISKLHK